jgi:hypothetical protein
LVHVLLFFFWIDRWYGECALFSIFSHLYFIAINPKITVAATFSAGKLHIEFKRQMVGIYLMEWDQLVKDLDKIILCSIPDIPIWR